MRDPYRFGPDTSNERGLARLLAVTVQAMAASARTGRTREELRAVVKQFVKLLR